jgi:hypothetical protein
LELPKHLRKISHTAVLAHAKVLEAVIMIPVGLQVRKRKKAERKESRGREEDSGDGAEEKE